MKMVTDELTWYEDGEMVEYWETEDPKSRKIHYWSIEEAIKFAQKTKMVLIIQPAYQDECIFIDFTE